MKRSKNLKKITSLLFISLFFMIVFGQSNLLLLFSNSKFIYNEQEHGLSAANVPESASFAESSWTKQYGSNDFLSEYTAIDSQNNLIVLTEKKTSDTNIDLEIYKIAHSDGSILWQKTYSSSGNESSNFLLVDSKNNVFVVGNSIYDDSTDDKIILIGISSSGSTLFSKSYSFQGSYNASVAKFFFDYDENLIIVANLQKSDYGDQPTGIYALVVSSADGNTLSSITESPNDSNSYVYKDAFMMANNKALIVCQNQDNVCLIGLCKDGSYAKQINGVFRDAINYERYIFLAYNIKYQNYDNTYLRLKLIALSISNFDLQADNIYSSELHANKNYTLASIATSTRGDILLSYENNYLDENNNSAGYVIFKKISVRTLSWQTVKTYEINNQTGLTYGIASSAMDFDGTAAILIDELNTILNTHSYTIHMYNIRTNEYFAYNIASGLPFGTTVYKFYFQPSGRLFIQFLELVLFGTGHSSWYLIDKNINFDSNSPIHSSVSLGSSGSDSYRGYAVTSTDDNVIFVGAKGLITDNLDAFVKIYDEDGNLVFDDIKKAPTDSNESFWQTFIRNDSIYVTGFAKATPGLTENIFLAKYTINSTIQRSEIDPNKIMIQTFDYSGLYLKPIRPIDIRYDLEFDYYLDLFIGSGTLEDPYILSNSYINGFNDEIGIFIDTPKYYYSIDNCKIENVIATTNSGGAIFIRNSRNYLVSITNNTLQSSTIGIFLQYNSNYGGYYSIIADNNITGNQQSGIYGDGIQYFNITGNSITNNVENGLSLDGCFHNNIFENKITNNNNYGILLVGHSDNNAIFDNQLCNNGAGALKTDEDVENTLKNNECASNGEIPGFNPMILSFVSSIAIIYIAISRKNKFE